MSRTRIKICGFTRLEDVNDAVALGVDALGFVFVESSPRCVKIDQVKVLIQHLPPFVQSVGLFMNQTVQELREVLQEIPLNLLQFHGDETPEFCEQFKSVNVRTMKAIRVKDKSDIERAEDFFTDAILLDAFHPEKYGGTGLTFDWNIVGHIGKRVFLAGGINPENVVRAVELGVYGIDVCSGVEAKPGKKDHKKLKKLFKNIRHLRA